MISLIGLSVDEAKSIAHSEGYDTIVIENDSDKMESYDATLVTNAVMDNGVVKLTTSHFLLRVEE